MHTPPENRHLGQLTNARRGTRDRTQKKHFSRIISALRRRTAALQSICAVIWAVVLHGWRGLKHGMKVGLQSKQPHLNDSSPRTFQEVSANSPTPLIAPRFTENPAPAVIPQPREGSPENQTFSEKKATHSTTSTIVNPTTNTTPTIVTQANSPQLSHHVQAVSSQRSHYPTEVLPPHNAFWAFFDSFLKVQNSAHTRRAYEKDLHEFLTYLKHPNDDGTERTMSVHTLVEYREYLSTKPNESANAQTNAPTTLSRVSINRKIASIKSFLNFLVLNGVIPNNPARAVKSYRAEQISPTRDISNDRVQKMLELPNRHRRSGAMHRAILFILFRLGLRRAELLSLRTGNIFQHQNQWVIRIQGKGDKQRLLPLPKDVHQSILDYLYISKRTLEDDAPLFMPVKNNATGDFNKPLNPNTIAYIVKYYAKLAGVDYRVSPHSARATAVSNALDNQAPHRAVQHMAGWSSPLMVTRYDKRKEDLKNSGVRFVNYSQGEPTTLLQNRHGVPPTANQGITIEPISDRPQETSQKQTLS